MGSFQAAFFQVGLRDDNLLEALVVVCAVVAHIRAGYCPATNNAFGSTAAGMRWCNGVFAVVAALAQGQDALAVAKNRAVFFVRKHTAAHNRAVNLLANGRQCIKLDAAWVCRTRHFFCVVAIALRHA